MLTNVMMYVLIAVSIPAIFALNYYLINRYLDEEGFFDQPLDTNGSTGKSIEDTGSKGIEGGGEEIMCPECGESNKADYIYCKRCITRLM